MIINYVFINEYLNCHDVEINLDNKFDYNIDKNSESIKIEVGRDIIPKYFFAENVNMSCFIGRNGSGKSLIMNLLTSFGNGVSFENNNGHFKVVFCDDHGFYYLFVVENGNRFLKKGIPVKQDDGYLISLKDANLSELDEYHSYYLSSNNTNMMKSWIKNVDNDYSVGNERRYKGLHSLVEISQFIRALPFENDLEGICKRKHVRLVISDRWLSQLNLNLFDRYDFKRHDFTSLVRRIKNNDKDRNVIIARLIMLRIISSNSHKKNSYLSNYSNDKFESDIGRINGLYIDAIEKSDMDYLSEQPLFYNHALEERVAVLSEIISFQNNEIEFYFSIQDSVHLDVLKYLLNISMENEIIADGYKYYFYPPFSTGQWKRVELVCKLKQLYLDSKSTKNNKSVNIFIDEPDADLHPEAQTNLVLWLVNLMKDMDIYFNVILSSHNPLILSDFPRRKVIYIGDDVHVADKVKTLGANVYNLYKNSFLVTNIISDFIRLKIEGAMNSNNIDDISFLINEISEPLLVKSLVSHLNKIFNDNNRQNERINSFVDGLSQSEKEFLIRRLKNGQ